MVEQTIGILSTQVLKCANQKLTLPELKNLRAGDVVWVKNYVGEFVRTRITGNPRYFSRFPGVLHIPVRNDWYHAGHITENHDVRIPAMPTGQLA